MLIVARLRDLALTFKNQSFCFLSGCSHEEQIYVLPETTKNWGKKYIKKIVLKTLDIRQPRRVTPERKQMKWAEAPVRTRRNFQSSGTGNKNPQSTRVLPKLRRQTWQFRKVKMARVCLHEYGSPPFLFPYLVEYWPPHTCEETASGQGRNHPEGLEGAVPKTHTELATVLVLNSQ